mmetsp:Transcript_8497/g.18062  ORF Transcript_8497/g.18062 Transcript_8497/m.18062 type:complete len:218 (+) Transcript_8497:200-853(+)
MASIREIGAIRLELVPTLLPDAGVWWTEPLVPVLVAHDLEVEAGLFALYLYEVHSGRFGIGRHLGETPSVAGACDVVAPYQLGILVHIYLVFIYTLHLLPRHCSVLAGDEELYLILVTGPTLVSGPHLHIFWLWLGQGIGTFFPTGRSLILDRNSVWEEGCAAVYEPVVATSVLQVVGTVHCRARAGERPRWMDRLVALAVQPDLETLHGVHTKRDG